jgi:hypothetical protein
MDVLVAAATMDSDETLATTTPHSLIAITTAPMEATSATGSKRAANNGRESKPKVVKKPLSKEGKCV